MPPTVDDDFDDGDWRHEQDDEGPGEHDGHLMGDDDAGDLAKCPACGAAVWADAEYCDRCGEHFAGQAWQGRPAGSSGPRAWWWWVAVGLLFVFLLPVLLLLRRLF